MAEIQLKKLTKRWGNFTAVDDFNLTIAIRSFLYYWVHQVVEKQQQ